MATMTAEPQTAYLDEPAAGRLNIRYAPEEGAEIAENPPRFTWLPVVDEAARYVLRLSADPEYADAQTRVFTDLPLNFLTPDAPLAPGRWHWSYAVWDEGAERPATRWSTSRVFDMSEGLPETPLPSRAERYAKADMAHPRLWLGPKELKAFRKDVAADPEHCNWQNFFDKSVAPWLDREIMAEPAPYPNNTRTAPIWRQTYIDCQELIYAIRHLAVAGKVLEDEAMLARSKGWLLSAADWDPAGTTSRG